MLTFQDSGSNTLSGAFIALSVHLVLSTLSCLTYRLTYLL